ncbi:MAG: helix-turn-helix domain-containing protein [Rhodospirillaceae bacterium]
MNPESATGSASGLEPILVTVKTACHLIGLRPTKLYELIGEGAIESTKIGGKRLLVYASLKRLIERRAAPASQTNT